MTTSDLQQIGTLLDFKFGVFSSDLDKKLAGFATKEYLDEKLENFATKDYLDQKLESFATKDYLDEKLKGFATKDYLDQQLKNFATKDDLKDFATKDDLKNFATKDDLKDFATKEDLKDFATKEYMGEQIEWLATIIQGQFQAIDLRFDRIEAELKNKPDRSEIVGWAYKANWRHLFDIFTKHPHL